jgi:hypothetical protein
MEGASQAAMDGEKRPLTWELRQQFPVSPGQFAIFPFLMKSRAIFRDLASDDVNSWSEFACLTRLFHFY